MIILKGAAIFAVIALMRGVLGFGELAEFSWDIAKILFWIAAVIAVTLAGLGLTIYKTVTGAPRPIVHVSRTVEPPGREVLGPGSMGRIAAATVVVIAIVG